MAIFIFLIVSYILLSISLFFLFPKAEVDGWKGLVPGLNFMEWCKLIGRKPLYALWLLFPIVNIFIFTGMAVDMVRSFKKYKYKHSAIAVIYAPAIFFKLAFTETDKYDGPTLIKEQAFKEELEKLKTSPRKYQKLLASNPYKKSSSREWAEAIVFAVFAAAFIRMFLIEAYKIPTPSMEGSLLVGDFLFVSKAHYGIRTPKTPVMIPLLHNRIPIFGGESYLKKPNLPVRRLPALETIDRYEPIVFNWPVGDSVYLTPQRSWSYGQAQRDPQVKNAVRGSKLITRPIDKKDHYIKRCMGLPGDTLQVINRQVHINGQPAKNPTNMQFLYVVRSQIPMSRERLEDVGIDKDDMAGDNFFFMTEAEAEVLQSWDGVEVSVWEGANRPGGMFPHDQSSANWSNDNYGPVWIPRAGVTVPVNMNNIARYKRVIGVYEENDLKMSNGQIYINGQPATEYTFKQDYYWAMGDNRHNSEDSRAWGFVPADHIVGKPLFIWMSAKDGIRWNRIFTSAYKM